MRAINHALTGALIGLTVDEPLLAGTGSLVSHYLLDMLPHFGPGKVHKKFLLSSSFRNSLFVDAFLCFLLVLLLSLTRPHRWLQAAICAFIATAPDLFWYAQYKQARQKKRWKPGVYARFASRIQWFERPIGAVVEVAWLIAGVSLLLPFVR